MLWPLTSVLNQPSPSTYPSSCSTYQPAKAPSFFSGQINLHGELHPPTCSWLPVYSPSYVSLSFSETQNSQKQSATCLVMCATESWLQSASGGFKDVRPADWSVLATHPWLHTFSVSQGDLLQKQQSLIHPSASESSHTKLDRLGMKIDVCACWKWLERGILHP